MAKAIYVAIITAEGVKHVESEIISNQSWQYLRYRSLKVTVWRKYFEAKTSITNSMKK